MGMNNGNFRSYQFEDLITDESFISYCLRDNPVNIKYWQHWIVSHPEKRILIDKAAYYVRNFTLTLPEEEYQEELTKIKSSIEPAPGSAGYRSIFKLLQWNKPLKEKSGTGRRIIRWLLPLMVVLLSAGYFIIQRSSYPASGLAEDFNTGNIPLVVKLSDGTVITLFPHSGIRYPRSFDPTVRMVFLIGEASFQVAADINHPFKVYQDDLVATVLGTVFTIRREQKDSVTMVELMKGKLEVEIIATTSIPMQSILLQPNERVVYNRYNKKFYKEKWQGNPTPVR
jgi:transmembrane sensor